MSHFLLSEQAEKDAKRKEREKERKKLKKEQERAKEVICLYTKRFLRRYLNHAEFLTMEVFCPPTWLFLSVKKEFELVHSLLCVSLCPFIANGALCWNVSLSLEPPLCVLQAEKRAAELAAAALASVRGTPISRRLSKGASSSAQSAGYQEVKK